MSGWLTRLHLYSIASVGWRVGKQIANVSNVHKCHLTATKRNYNNLEAAHGCLCYDSEFLVVWMATGTEISDPIYLHQTNHTSDFQHYLNYIGIVHWNSKSCTLYCCRVACKFEVLLIYLFYTMRNKCLTVMLFCLVFPTNDQFIKDFPTDTRTNTLCI